MTGSSCSTSRRTSPCDTTMSCPSRSAALGGTRASGVHSYNMRQRMMMRAPTDKAVHGCLRRSARIDAATSAPLSRTPPSRADMVEYPLTATVSALPNERPTTWVAVCCIYATLLTAPPVAAQPFHFQGNWSAAPSERESAWHLRITQRERESAISASWSIGGQPDNPSATYSVKASPVEPNKFAGLLYR